MRFTFKSYVTLNFDDNVPCSHMDDLAIMALEKKGIKTSRLLAGDTLFLELEDKIELEDNKK